MRLRLQRRLLNALDPASRAHHREAPRQRRQLSPRSLGAHPGPASIPSSPARADHAHNCPGPPAGDRTAPRVQPCIRTYLVAATTVVSLAQSRAGRPPPRPLTACGPQVEKKHSDNRAHQAPRQRLSRGAAPSLITGTSRRESASRLEVPLARAKILPSRFSRVGDQHTSAEQRPVRPATARGIKAS